MNTATTQGASSSTRRTERVRHWIGFTAMIALAVGASGCCRLIPGLCKDNMDALRVGGCITPDCGLSTTRAALLPSDCPTGQCDPDPNGLGIYVGEGGNYCRTGGATDDRFCPEAFVNTSTGVALRLRDRQGKNRVIESQPILGELVTGDPTTSGSVTVRAIRGNGTELAIDYEHQGAQRTLKGADVGKLQLWISWTVVRDGYRRSLKLTPMASNDPNAGQLRRYELSFQNDAGQWVPHCAQPQASGVGSPGAVFVPGKAVDGVNGAVTTDPNVTTVACQSGAIVSCLAWGYTPWDPATGQGDAKRDYVFGSCLQAKRAAYFVGRGDLSSYTTTGTPILKRDQFGYGAKQELDTEAVEALWSPRGAECLNLQHRRHPEIPIADTHGVPPCPKPVDWMPEAKLATSVDKP